MFVVCGFEEGVSGRSDVNWCQEKNKSRQRQMEVLTLQQQLDRMTTLFWGVTAVATMGDWHCPVRLFVLLRPKCLRGRRGGGVGGHNVEV